MNTRLQVEHPVTELVTGIDLVREQITVAAGEPLSFRQEDVHWRGHAIECRVYAEDPRNNFFPSPGRITSLQTPAGPGIRDDSGVDANSEVSIHYDPMISKLAAWGANRNEAIDRLRRALDEYHVGGIKTTLPFFRQIVRDAEFIAGKLDTGFIERFQERLERAFAVNTESNSEEVSMALIAAALQYAQQLTSSAQNHDAEQQNRWKMSGRAAALEARKVIDDRLSRREGARK
jgi:acetyl-CoA carboxylase biotin carboxylase subunit